MAKREIQRVCEYDFLIVNDDFDCALTEFDTIIKGQRLAQVRQSALHRNMISELLA